MNHRTFVAVALVAMCLSVSSAMAQAADLRYPVAFDDRTGPVYYQGNGLLSLTPITTVSTSYRLDEPPNEPAPAYTQPTPTYAPPAATYNPPAPSYPQPVPNYVQAAPVYSQPVAPTYVQPNYLRQTVTTTYTPVRSTYTSNTAYTPATTYSGTVNYVPRTTYSPTCVATYQAPVYRTMLPVATGPRVYVHPKVYVEGQPIRNLLKAITP